MNHEQLRVIVGALTRSDVERDKIMQAVDQYTADMAESGRETWTAAQVAHHIGVSSPASARVWCARNGVKSVGSRTIPGQRGAFALYPADLVRKRASQGTTHNNVP